LAAKVVTVMLGEWCGTWTDTMPLRPLLLRNETSGRFLQTSSSETMMLSLTIETKIAQSTEQIHLAFPQSNLEPLMQKLCLDLQNVEKASLAPSAARLEWNPAFNDVPLQIKARWHALEMTARQISELKLGDVVPLQDGGPSPVELSMDSTPKFTGQLGTSGRKLAIRIVQAL
jgi:flagellar motor switch protein FliM